MPSKILSLTRKPPPALIVLSGLVPVPSLTTLPRFLVLTNRRVIAALLGQIDVRRTYDIRRLGAGIEARLIAADQQLQAYASFAVLNDFSLVGAEGRWRQFCNIKPLGREWLRQLATAHLDWAAPDHT